MLAGQFFFFKKKKFNKENNGKMEERKQFPHRFHIDPTVRWLGTDEPGNQLRNVSEIHLIVAIFSDQHNSRAQGCTNLTSTT
jgi:hypothetical protein